MGAIAGRLYAISTIGSLVGTFLPTLVLLPVFGTRRTMLLAAAALLVLGIWLTVRRRTAAIVGALVLVLVLVPDRPIPWFLGGTTIAQADSRYQLLRVVDVAPTNFSPSTEGEREGEAKHHRLLVFNEGLGIQSRAVFDPAAIEGYFPIVAALPAILCPPTRGNGAPAAGSGAHLGSVYDRAGTVPEPKVRASEGGIAASERAGRVSVLEVGARPQRPACRTPTILILGNAGGTIGNLMERFFPDAPLAITGVELDPAVTAITAAHFPPPPQSYPVMHADSRVFLQGTEARYDIIVADAYTSQLTIPPHLVTREFFDLVRTRLTPGGMLVANVNAPTRDSILLRLIEQTVAAVFPHVVVGKAGETWNYLIMASDQPIHDRLPALGAPRLPESATTEVQRFLDTVEPVTADRSRRHFTDDWAPLELFTDLEIFEAIKSSS